MDGIILGILVFWPFLGGILVYGAGRKKERLRQGLAVGVTVSEFLLTAGLAGGVLAGGALGALADGGGRGLFQEEFLSLDLPGLCGLGVYLTLDGFRLIFGLAASFMWVMAALLCGEYFQDPIHPHKDKDRFYLFLLLTLGAAMGVFLAADLFTAFLFFEIMSFTSYVWVAQEEGEQDLRAAATYLAVAVFGGMVLLMGLFLLWNRLGTLYIRELPQAVAASLAQGEGGKTWLYAAGVCVLTGFGAKAGSFPLHVWLPKAYPAAPAPAAALLSGILTKTGIFGVLAVTCGLFAGDGPWGVLVLALGVLTMAGGAVLALFSVDLKRILACSSMSQIGFILVGVGMQALLGEDNALAVHGTLLHMVNHSLIKLVLFLGAGVIFMNVRSLDLNEIRGFGRKKPLLAGCFLVGALAVAGVPFFGGYVSKTLLHESITAYGGGWLMKAVEWLFLISGGLTAAYMAKIFAAVFVEKNRDGEKQAAYDACRPYKNRQSGFALAGSGAVLLIWGLFPHGIMDRAAALGQGFMGLGEFGERVSYFSLKNLAGAGISLGIGALVYFLAVRRVLIREGRYADLWPKWLDLEELVYRPLLLKLLPFVCGVVCRAADSFVDLAVVALRKTVYRDSPLPHELTEGNGLTYLLGKLMNGVQSLANKTWRRRNPGEKDYVHVLAVKREALRESNTIIGRSLSFGLLLFCVGLVLTLVYILWLG